MSPVSLSGSHGKPVALAAAPLRLHDSAMNDSKQIAADLFARFTAGDVTGALDLMTDDVTWRIAGKRELLATAGVYDKARLRRLFDRMYSQLVDGLKMTVLS